MHNAIRIRIRIVLHVQNTCQGVAGTHINQTPMQGQWAGADCGNSAERVARWANNNKNVLQLVYL